MLWRVCSSSKDQGRPKVNEPDEKFLLTDSEQESGRNPKIQTSLRTIKGEEEGARNQASLTIRRDPEAFPKEFPGILEGQQRIQRAREEILDGASVRKDESESSTRPGEEATRRELTSRCLLCLQEEQKLGCRQHVGAPARLVQSHAQFFHKAAASLAQAVSNVAGRWTEHDSNHVDL